MDPTYSRPINSPRLVIRPPPQGMRDPSRNSRAEQTRATTVSRAGHLLEQFQGASQANEDSFREVLDDLTERSQIIRDSLRVGRDLRLALVQLQRGVVTNEDREKHAPPRMRPSSKGGCSEVSVYLSQTLELVLGQIISISKEKDHQEVVMTREVTRFDSLTEGALKRLERDDDDITIHKGESRIVLDRGGNYHLTIYPP